MDLYGYAAMDKITTYKFNLNKKTILFDYGAKVDKISDVDYIFLSHEHFDHYEGLQLQALEISEKTRIFSTKTTKLLLIELISMNLSTLDLKTNEKQRILKIVNNIETYSFLEEVKLDNGLSFVLYPSGHTYGSAMVYLMGDKKILYTGDMDYHPKIEDRRFYFDKREVDLLICDGTKLMDDEKEEYNNYSNLKRNVLTFKVRCEKAVFLANKLANTSYFKNYKIYFEKDLKWFLDILYKQGYNPFINGKVMLDITGLEKEKPYILLSSHKYEKFKRNGFLSLHIAKNDLLDFIDLVNAKKVLIGHYDLKNPPLDFYVVKGGLNEISFVHK